MLSFYVQQAHPACQRRACRLLLLGVHQRCLTAGACSTSSTTNIEAFSPHSSRGLALLSCASHSFARITYSVFPFVLPHYFSLHHQTTISVTAGLWTPQSAPTQDQHFVNRNRAWLCCSRLQAGQYHSVWSRVAKSKIRRPSRYAYLFSSKLAPRFTPPSFF